ncbi:MAG: hypothetical protein FWF12_00120 [Betaproteobacteria bacterium]|nr:hypothetical protein [Betaproteobacteria bacterium]
MTDIEIYRALPEAERERLGFAAWKHERRQGTHGPDCHRWGSSHYDCLLSEYDKLDSSYGLLEYESVALKKKAERYERIRTLNPREYSELWTRHISTGERFDDLVDAKFAEVRKNTEMQKHRIAEMRR